MRAPAPLASAHFRWFFTGRSLSFLGSSMVPVALAFAVLEISDSAAALGIVLAARSIPQAGFMLAGGVIADRFSRRTVLVVAGTLSGMTQAVAATLLISGHAHVWNLAVTEAVNGTVTAFTFPAMASIVPMVVSRSDLQQSNALLGFSRNGMLILGPSIAALLVVTVGSGWAIAADAMSFVLAAYCMTRLQLAPAGREEPTSMLHDLRVGWSAFTSRSWLWIVVVAFGVLNMVEAGILNTLGPVIAERTFGAGGWGAVMSGIAIGFLVMSLLLLRWQLRFPLRAGLIGIALLAGPMLLLGLWPSAGPMVVLAVVGGMGAEVFSVGWQTAMHEHVPTEVLSRVFSYDALGSLLAVPIGQLLAGPLGGLFGPRDVAVAGGALYLLVAVSTLTAPSVRNLTRERGPVPTG